jgi:ABC-2 type transport system permease protein
MRKFYTLLSREVSSYFYSPIAYIVLFFFLVVSGADFYFQVSFMNQRPVQYSVQEAFFNSVFFWFAFVLIFPLITMRTFAEEFKLGTIEPLMTAPVRDWQVVLAKFFGAMIFYVGPLGPHSGLLRDLPIRHAPDRGRDHSALIGVPI